MTWTLVVLWWALLLTAFACFRLSKWHRHEAGFWKEIQIFHDLELIRDEVALRDLLAWTKENPPSVWERVYRGWQAPHVRRRDVEPIR